VYGQIPWSKSTGAAEPECCSAAGVDVGVLLIWLVVNRISCMSAVKGHRLVVMNAIPCVARMAKGHRRIRHGTELRSICDEVMCLRVGSSEIVLKVRDAFLQSAAALPIYVKRTKDKGTRTVHEQNTVEREGLTATAYTCPLAQKTTPPEGTRKENLLLRSKFREISSPAWSHRRLVMQLRVDAGGESRWKTW
jgi:hypothetical protein